MDSESPVGIVRTVDTERPLPPLPGNDGLESNNDIGITMSDRIAGGSSSRDEARSRASSRSVGSDPQGMQITDRFGISTKEPSLTSAVGEASTQPSRYRSRGSSSVSGRSQQSESRIQNTPAGATPNISSGGSFSSPRSRSSSSVQGAFVSQTPGLPVGSYQGGNSHNDPSELLETSSNQVETQSPRTERDESAEVLVPRWQPDAEVTLCPICRTQFSFFIRKHHCRKCGRVVCSSCSPHRIIIPYQYIVQPPIDGNLTQSSTSRTRPGVDSVRLGSSIAVDSFEGGERVRLCNPCVPDPNIAPPQTTQPINNTQRYYPSSGHGRSSSNTVSSHRLPPSGSTMNPRNFPSSIITNSREQAGFSNIARSSAAQSRGTSYSERGLLRAGLEARSRSSTVGNTPQILNMGQPQSNSADNSNARNSSSSRPTHRPGGSRTENDIVPNRLADSLQRAAPPQPRRRVIAEEDLCPVCHLELPSRTLPNFSNLREHHIESCISNAMQGSTISSRPAAPSPIPSNGEGSYQHPIPVPNTPEARMAAREQAHAAIVLGQGSSSNPIRRVQMYKYKATEKDCIDDAECTICLEEFEVGIDMSRLECFCRFHLKCINDWWVEHPNQCPVHQHGAGY